MNENISAQFKTEGAPAFPVEDTETDNSADSQSVETEDTKETDTDQTQSDDGEQKSDENKDGGDTDTKGDENLADHPRWKEREGDWKDRFNEQETRHTDAIQQLREDFEEKYSGPKPLEAPGKVPSWFGGDETQWSDFKEYNQDLIDKSQQNIQKGIDKKSEDNQKALDEATDYLNSEISDIENDKVFNPDGLKIDRNKLLKFVMDEELVDTSGKWNYKAGWKLMQAGVKSTKKATIDEKKIVAGASTDKGGAETEKPDITTSKHFDNPSNRPW